MKETEENEKVEMINMQKNKNEKIKNAETLAAVHTHKCFKE